MRGCAAIDQNVQQKCPTDREHKFDANHIKLPPQHQIKYIFGVNVIKQYWGDIFVFFLF